MNGKVPKAAFHFKYLSKLSKFSLDVVNVFPTLVFVNRNVSIS